MIKFLKTLLILCAVTIFAASACDEEGSNLPIELSVGSACTSDAECPGPGTPQCLIDGIFPLEEMANSDSGMAQDLADIYVPLPDGYCSTVPPCTTNADCGLGGACFFPLRDVDPDVFADMIDLMQEKFGLNDDEAASVAAFSDFGQCLTPCEKDEDCRREGYFCKTPLLDLLALVPDSDKSTFCIGEDL
jgi:hypothetical protein